MESFFHAATFPRNPLKTHAFTDFPPQKGLLPLANSEYDSDACSHHMRLGIFA
jgi:hypothetical protein